MSFLTSIVARAAGLAPAVEPRLPSRYERDAAADMVEVSAEVPAERAEAPAAPWSAAARRRLPDDAPPPAQSGSELPHSKAEPPVHLRSAAAQAPLSERRLRRRTPKEEPPAAKPPQPASVIESHAAPPLPAEMPPEPPAPEVLVIHHEEEAPLRTLIQSHRETTTNIIERELLTREVREKAAPAPTIRVTIGRVDVRAVTAPAPEKREAPKRAVFTIEDYIRLRKEGRR